MKVLFISDTSAIPQLIDIKNGKPDKYYLINDAPISTHRKHIAGRLYEIEAGFGAKRRPTAYDSNFSTVFMGNIIIKNIDGDITAEDLAHISKNIKVMSSAWITWTSVINVDP